MLNEEKIKLMAGIAMFEQKEGKKISSVNNYFKKEYIDIHMIRAFFAYTISALLVALIWVLYNTDAILKKMTTDYAIGLLKQFGFLYVLGLILYFMITRKVYAERYDYAARCQKVYIAKLRRLDKRYEMQNKEIMKEVD